MMANSQAKKQAVIWGLNQRKRSRGCDLSREGEEQGQVRVESKGQRSREQSRVWGEGEAFWPLGAGTQQGKRLSQKPSASGAGGFGTQLLNHETNFTGKLRRAPGSFWCQNTAGKLLDSHSL